MNHAFIRMADCFSPPTLLPRSTGGSNYTTQADVLPPRPPFAVAGQPVLPIRGKGAILSQVLAACRRLSDGSVPVHWN